MRRLSFFLLVLASLYGCVSPAITPPKDRIASLTHAYIVAMEPRPLGLPPGFTFVHGPGFPIQMARGVGLFNTIAIFLEMPEASKRGEEATQSLQAILNAKGAWIPTVVLANEVSRQLAASGVPTNVSKEVKPIPGVQNRGYTVTQENWMAPIRAHYNDPGPVHDYRALASNQSLYVLEVSISNYEVTPEILLLQVHLKMIVPSDGLVLGRSRAAKWVDLPPLKVAFADDAIRFKEVFAEMGRELVKRCLTELGLISSTN